MGSLKAFRLHIHFVALLLILACGKVPVELTSATNNGVQDLGNPLTLSITASTQMVQNTCNAITAIFRRGSNIVAPPSSVLMVLTSNGGGTFFSSSTCASGSQIQSSGWMMSQAINTIYYQPSTLGAQTLSAQGGGVAASFGITVVSSGSTSNAINGLRITGPSSVASSACNAITIETLLNNSVTVTSSDVPLSFTYTTVQSGFDYLFESATDCQAGSPQVNQSTIFAGTSSRVLYLKSRNPSTTTIKQLTVNAYGPSNTTASLPVTVGLGQAGPTLKLFGYPSFAANTCSPFYLQLVAPGTETPVPSNGDLNVSVTGFPAGSVFVTCPGGVSTNTVTILNGQSSAGFFGKVVTPGTYPLTISAPNFQTGTYNITVTP